jgi:serine phosphatase RsbU (regulator of sigma subunit)/anti-sigma regulatory factor (Ser/Thr protein kinase)/transposase
MNLPNFVVRLASYLPVEPKRRMFRLEIPSVEIELLAVKDFVQRVCDAAGCNSKETSNIKLAIDEACSNIIRHAYQGKSDGKIVLEMGISIIDLKIKITDYGKSFKFKNIKDPDLNHYVDIGKKGGLGIWLIKKVMTRVSYKAYPDHNELVLYRRLSKLPPQELGLKKGSFSISTKFTMGSMALVVFLILSAYFFLTYRQKSFVDKQQKEKVNLIVQTIASEAGAPVSRKSDLDLDRLIREVRREDLGKIFDYVFIVGPDGKYLAHSDLNQLFKLYAPPPGAPAVKTPGVQSFKMKVAGETLTDYASPIYFHGQWVGEVHAGVSDKAILQLAEKVKSDFRNLVLVILVISVLGLYFLSRIVIRPFQKILEGVHAISSGDLNAKIDVTSQDEFGQMAGIFNDMTSRIQESQKGMIDQERLQQEMQVAQEIQHTLLPAEFPQIEGYEIGATYRSAKEVGGDYYDFFWVDPTTLGIVVADVSGKGVPGSMVMTMIRTAMRLEARGNKSAADVLAKVNTHVTGDMKKGMFVTMFYIILDSRDRSINFASAGHNPMILYRGTTKEVYFLKPKGFPVGIDLPEEDMFANNMALQKVSLQKNDILVIYTDGITEAMNPEKLQFGEDRLVQVIKENSHLTPSEFVEKLNESIAQFTRGAEQNDDITVVAIKEKMQAEQVEFKFRKKLIDLVEKKGLSIAEACRQMNISPNTYYRYKKIFDEKGKAGLKPTRAKKRDEIDELSLPQKQAVTAIIKAHPEYGPQRITEVLRKSTNPPMKVERRVVTDYLKRKGLSDVKERKYFALNEVDTV